MRSPKPDWKALAFLNHCAQCQQMLPVCVLRWAFRWELFVYTLLHPSKSHRWMRRFLESGDSDLLWRLVLSILNGEIELKNRTEEKKWSKSMLYHKISCNRSDCARSDLNNELTISFLHFDTISAWTRAYFAVWNNQGLDLEALIAQKTHHNPWNTAPIIKQPDFIWVLFDVCPGTSSLNCFLNKLIYSLHNFSSTSLNR